ncbi:MAG: hypothetical protein KC636_04190 [Myxococcales bacterium]|nr:hypothetical protein [Myxococcales bacterium]
MARQARSPEADRWRRRLKPAQGRWIAALLAAAIATAPPSARASPASTDTKAATARYKEGVKALRKGEVEAAAEKFEEALALVPAAELEVRAAVLFDLVDARRQTHEATGALQHLCAARDALTDYLDEAEAAGEASEGYPDVRKAHELRVELLESIHVAERKDPSTRCDVGDAAPTEAPAEEPAEELDAPPPSTDADDRRLDKRGRVYLITGSALAGVGLIFLGVMAGGLAMGASAERDGEALVDAGIDSGQHVSMSDPALEAIASRGRTGNALAVAGGVIGVAAAGAGAALIVLALRRRGRSQARLSGAPYVLRGGAGVSLGLRF